MRSAAYWERRIAEIEREIREGRAGQHHEQMLRDAINALRYVKSHQQNMSKQRTQ